MHVGKARRLPAVSLQASERAPFMNSIIHCEFFHNAKDSLCTASGHPHHPGMFHMAAFCKSTAHRICPFYVLESNQHDCTDNLICRGDNE